MSNPHDLIKMLAEEILTREGELNHLRETYKILVAKIPVTPPAPKQDADQKQPWTEAATTLVHAASSPFTRNGLQEQLEKQGYDVDPLNVSSWLSRAAKRGLVQKVGAKLWETIREENE
ncbi:MAG: hypothetical protein PHW33_01205 [Candidatus Portnoybacteria bacterium]|jgi:hypothetical protein|nr:hypothetical protein [Candidatus Portnoybacteria bacterium]